MSCGDSSIMELDDQAVDLIVTDPPFFDNVHYSELADFFYAWQQIRGLHARHRSTRHAAEVQDTDPSRFAAKLQAVLRECNRVLKKNGLLVFSYHHSRDEGWHSLAEAVLGAAFTFVNSHPVMAEMSVATPKSQAKEPIQLDIILVCRKREADSASPAVCIGDALYRARAKILRLAEAGFTLSRNDRKVILFGQLLTTLSSLPDLASLSAIVSAELETSSSVSTVRIESSHQQLLF